MSKTIKQKEGQQKKQLEQHRWLPGHRQQIYFDALEQLQQQNTQQKVKSSPTNKSPLFKKQKIKTKQSHPKSVVHIGQRQPQQQSKSLLTKPKTNAQFIQVIKKLKTSGGKKTQTQTQQQVKSSPKVKKPLFKQSIRRTMSPSHPKIAVLTEQQEQIKKIKQHQLLTIKRQILQGKSPLIKSKFMKSFLQNKKQLENLKFEDKVVKSIVRLDRLYKVLQFLRNVRDNTRKHGFGLTSRNKKFDMGSLWVRLYLLKGTNDFLEGVLRDMFEKEIGMRHRILNLKEDLFVDKFTEMIEKDLYLDDTLNDLLTDIETIVSLQEAKDKTLLDTASRCGKKYLQSLKKIGSDISKHSQKNQTETERKANRNKRFFSKTHRIKT